MGRVTATFTWDSVRVLDDTVGQRDQQCQQLSRAVAAEHLFRRRAAALRQCHAQMGLQRPILHLQGAGILLCNG